MMERFIEGLAGIGGLNALSNAARNRISSNREQLEKLLQGGMEGLGRIVRKNHKADIMSFEEVVKQYNTGITGDEIKAWVYYKRGLGIPMHGWEAYFINSGTAKNQVLIATKTTVVRDNHFREIKTIPQGFKLGKWTGKTLEHSKDTRYYIYRSEDGLYYVNKDHCKISQTITVSGAELDRLVKAGVLFFSDGELLPHPVYVFGNIYDKISQLGKDKEVIIEKYGEAVYMKHIEVLDSKLPKMLSIYDKDISNRPYIAVFSEFAKSFRVSALAESTGVELKNDFETLDDAFVQWLNSLGDDDFEESSPFAVAEFYVHGKSPSPNYIKQFVEKRIEEIKKRQPGEVFTDKRRAKIASEIRTDIKAEAKNEGEKLFSRFLAEALPKPIQDKINLEWNKQFNGHAEIDYSRIPIGCELSRTWNNLEWKMKPVQREGVGFYEVVGSGIMRFDVGVGKTLTSIVEVAQALHDGKCSRPVIAVPNSVYEQFKTQITGEYDKKGNLIKTGILTGIATINDWGNLGKSKPGINVEKLNLDHVPEKSITIVTHSGLAQLGFSRDVAIEFIDELTNILSQREDGSARDNEKAGQKIAETIGNALEKNLAQVDKIGFDYLVIDEAHNFKNVFAQVKGKKEDKEDKRNTRRFSTTSGAISDRAVKAFFISNYIQRRYGKNIMLLTATPFQNQPIEIYSMLSLVGYDTLKQRNIQNLNDFFELHVNEQMEDVVTIKGNIEARPVVKSFNNRMLLQSLLYNHIISREAEGKYRPQKVNLPMLTKVVDGKRVKLKSSEQVLTYLQMNDWQRKNQEQIIRDIEYAIGTMSATRGKSGLGDIGRAMSQSLNNAFSPFLYEGELPKDHIDFVNNSPKVKYACLAIQSVKAYHEKRGEECSGIIIYVNRGKEYFTFIKEYLEKEVGFKRKVPYKAYCEAHGFEENEISDIRGAFDEVTIVEGGISADKKDSIKEAFQKGVIKVIIGTSTIAEGMDLQKRGTNIINLFPEYNPTQLHQLSGRIWRDGNPHGYVRITLPLIQDSMDVFIFQKLEEKTSRANDLWYRAENGNILQQDDLDPEEIKYALITNIDDLVELEVEKEKKDLERKISRLAANIDVLKSYKLDKERYLAQREMVLDSIRRCFEQLSLIRHVKFPPGKEQLKEFDKKK